MTPAAGRVFISYRREDTRHLAGRLHDRIVTHLRKVRVFMDVDTISPGDDFSEAITRAVSSCRVLVALIGTQWLSIADPKGRRRLDNQNDWVRKEIGVALARGIRVIPVLVDGASMPSADELPADLVPLTDRNAVRIDHETFAADADALISAIERDLAAQDEPTVPTLRARARAVGSSATIYRDRAADPAAYIQQTIPPGVSRGRALLRTGLWILTFLMDFITAGGLGLTLSGKQPSSIGALVITAIFFVAFGGVFLRLRTELVYQRSLVGCDPTGRSSTYLIPPPLRVQRSRILNIALVGAGALFIILYWFVL